MQKAEYLLCFRRFIAQKTCISFIFILFFLLPARSQDFRNGKVNLNLKGASLKEALAEVQKQSGVRFIYDDDINKYASLKITHVENGMPVKKATELVLRNTNLQYVVEGRFVIIRENTKPQPTNVAPKQQNSTIQGYILNSATSEPIPGATVRIIEQNQGVMSDGQGYYRITLPAGTYTLEASVIGFNKITRRVSVNGDEVESLKADFALIEANNDLNEVVIVGYGTQSRRSLTTAISRLDGKKMEGAPVNSVGDALKGKMGGVRVATTDQQPGSNPYFLIRGGSSINRSNAPIVLVDGVLRDITGLNPNDIESIEVLKDAASAGIYGARASNGVILITTKKGFKTGANITFQAQVAYQQPERKYNLMNAADYLKTLRPALAESLFPQVLQGAESGGTGNNDNSIWTTRYLEAGESVPGGWQSMPDPVDPAKTLVFQDNDQQKQWFNDAIWQSYYLGVTGGNDKMKYATSVGYTKDDGLGVSTGFSALTFHGNTSYDIVKRLTASSTFDYAQTDSQTFPGNKRNSVIRALAIPNTHRDYLADGTPALGPNATTIPAAFYKEYYLLGSVNKRSTFNINLNWEIADGLNAVAQFTNHNVFNRGNSFIRGNAISMLRETSESFSEANRVNFQAYANYKKYIRDEHKIDLLAGYDYNYDKANSFNASVTGAISDNVPTLSAGSIYAKPGSSRTREALLSYFGKANYSYLDRYLLSFTMRADASSKFSKENRWGYFPAGSLGWIVSDEGFWKKNNKISLLKLRASYGLTGNNSIGLTDTYGSYGTGSVFNGNPGITLGSMPNYSLKWESTAQLDIGVDLALFDNNLRFSADYYDKITKDLLFSVPLPDITGYSSTLGNVGKVKFYGFDFELSSTNTKSKNFEWNTEFTYSYNMNKVLKLNDNGIPGNRIGGIINGDGTQFGGIAESERLGRFYGYKVAYIIETQEQADAAMYDQSSRGFRRSDRQNSSINASLAGRKDIGDYEWVNREGSSQRDGKDQINAEDQFLLGYVNPPHTGGLTNTFRYKDFSLTVGLDYAIGHSIYNALQMRYFMATFGNANYNLVYDVMDTWKQPGDNTKYARFTVNDPDWGNQNYSRSSNIFTQKGDYVCLRDVTLSYNLPRRMISRLGLSNLTVSAGGNTLHYFTAVTGVSPEATAGPYSFVDTYSADYNPYPPARKLLFGIKATF